MREFREREVADQQEVQEEEAIIQPPPGQTQFAHGGEIPPVSKETSFEPHRAASSWAFDGDQQAAPKPAAERAPQQRTFQTGYGVYTVSYELVKLPRPDKGPDVKQDAMKLRMVFNPSALVKSQNMGFVQVARRSQDNGGSWSTKEGGAMTPQRAKRTDEKSGFRVDRDDEQSSPFYGTTFNDAGDLTTPATDSNRTGRHPMMTDRPWITKNNHMEFVTTATDIDTGQQFDAISWGFKADASSVNMIEPQLVQGADERLIGRDRAIHQWNELARTGADEDALPTQFDPVEDAKSLELAIPSKRVGIIRQVLEKHGTDRNHVSRIKQHYQYATDRDLSEDLKGVLDDKDEKRFKLWL